MFNIQERGGKPVKAICNFWYKGYTVSMSSLQKPRDIAIFLHGKLVRDGMVTIQSTIEFIDSMDNVKKLVSDLEEVMPSGLRVIDYIAYDNPKLIADLKKALEETK